MFRRIINKLIAISLLISLNLAHATTSDLESQSEDTVSSDGSLDSVPARRYAKKIACASLYLIGMAGVGIGGYIVYEKFLKDLINEDSTGSNPAPTLSPTLSPTIFGKSHTHEQVQILDRESGAFEHSFSNLGSGDRMLLPLGVTVDKEGKIYVLTNSRDGGAFTQYTAVYNPYTPN